jgi:hypothetical protein
VAITAEFIRERETKNTVRYQEQGDAPYIGTLYIQKFAGRDLGGALPERIRVTIEAA